MPSDCLCAKDTNCKNKEISLLLYINPILSYINFAY